MTAEERKQEALKERYDLTDWEADVMAETLEKQAAQFEFEKEEKKMTTKYDINGIEVTKKQLMKLADYVTRGSGNYCGISLVSLPDDEDIADYLKRNGVPVEDGMYYVDRGEVGDFPSAKDPDALLPALAREVEAAFPSRQETAEALKRA